MTNALAALFLAIAAVEGWKGPGTVGAAGERGPLAITPAFHQDAGLHGTLTDCERLPYARQVVIAYWRRYCPRALAAGDYRTLAAVHHHGPRGLPRNPPDDHVDRVCRLLNGRPDVQKGEK